MCDYVTKHYIIHLLFELEAASYFKNLVLLPLIALIDHVSLFIYICFISAEYDY
jgi:hypothetical protein